VRSSVHPGARGMHRSMIVRYKSKFLNSNGAVTTNAVQTRHVNCSKKTDRKPRGLDRAIIKEKR
jgi:hypothetical protein